MGGIPLLGVNAKSKAFAIQVEPFKNNDASCGCFARVSKKEFKYGKLIYQDMSIQKGRIIKMKIDGRVIKFTCSGNPQNKKYYSNKKGEIFKELLASKNYNVTSKWQTTKIKRFPDDEAANHLYYNVIFTIKKNGTKLKRELKAKGYCGC